jgi:hypothetical protein
MKKIFVIGLVATLISCGQKENQDKKESRTPEALQDKTLKRLTVRGNDLVDELYEELVSKSPQLQKLETDIDAFKPDANSGDFFDYESKSKAYYYSAKSYANTITDSITKKNVLELIEKSNKRYELKANDLNKLDQSIDDKEKALEDSHTILKIALTMPLIEKYQDENLPDKRPLIKMAQRQDSLIQRTQALTPKY